MRGDWCCGLQGEGERNGKGKRNARRGRGREQKPWRPPPFRGEAWWTNCGGRVFLGRSGQELNGGAIERQYIVTGSGRKHRHFGGFLLWIGIRQDTGRRLVRENWAAEFGRGQIIGQSSSFRAK